jgi:O-antigen/teichoic acid export membrane protein
LFTLAAAVAVPLMVPYLEQPLLKDYVPIFWIMLVATLLRIAADAYGFALLALHRDRAIAAVGLAGALVSAVLNLTLTPLAGLWGASFAYLLTSGGLFTARYRLSRPERAPADMPATESLSYRPD